MDTRVYLAQQIEKINGQRIMITAIIRGMVSGLTRQQRRHYPLVYEGKRITMLEYLAKLGGMLPSMMDKEERPIDHIKILSNEYMINGAVGVDTYLKNVVGVLGDTINQLTQNEQPI